MHPRRLPSSASSYVRDATDPRRLERAIGDLRAGFRQWRLALALARLDIRNRYRGSVLGPLWLTLSTAVTIVGVGLVFSGVFGLPLAEYLPFLAVSLLIWNMINLIVQDACGNLTGSEGIIRQMPLPYTIHVLRCLFRNALIAAHNLPLIVVVFAMFGLLPGPEALLSLVGLALIALNAFALALLLGMVCARFRDVPQIVASVMQLAFLLSPIIWKPELLQGRVAWLYANPIYVLLETVRGPLLGAGAPLSIWLTALAYTAACCAAAAAFFVRFRARIAFWV
jgi:lipopolysaccharide transport system permease protein